MLRTRSDSGSHTPSRAKEMALRSAEIAESPLRPRMVTMCKSDGFLGITAANNVEGLPGVVVVTAKIGGLADKAGFGPGTVILSVNGAPCTAHGQVSHH